MTRVRVRGIYATALTELLRGAFEVVQASPPIERRFEAAFDVRNHDVAVETTPDRQGVGVVGDPDGVEAIRDRLRVGLDALSWTDPAPRGAVFDAEVTEELGSGAVVDLGPTEGFLPYDATDDHVTAGDDLRVQVHDPAPPWGDRRPEVGARIVAFGGLADLVRGRSEPRAEVSDPETASELVRATAMLPTDPPDGWGVRWRREAADADVDALDGALATARERAEALSGALDGGDPPEAVAWVWFGRESRFELDDRRREVAPTIAGHHRIKAGGNAASSAVDFAEGLYDPPEEFPFDLVARTFGPAVGDELRIDHGKPDGRRFPLGRGEVVAREGETVTLRREMTAGGEYDALGVPREAGDTATTKLKEGRWWYPTVYRSEGGAVKGTYVNVCTPVELFPDAATYVDLHVDVVRRADGEVCRVDDDELDDAVAAGDVPGELAAKAREVATAVERALSG